METAPTEKIAKKPANYEDRIKQLIQTKNFLHQSFNSKHKIIHDLVDEIREMLIQEGVPTEKIGENMWRYEPKYKPSI
ncbi:MAG: hypothetical protein ACUVTB_00720 [Candidatus Bathycorpusculaceae bacterium]